MCGLYVQVTIHPPSTPPPLILPPQGSVLQTTLEQAQRAQREAEATITTLTQHNAQLQQALESTHSAAEEQQALNEEALKIREVLIGTLREEMEEAAVEGSRVLEEIKVWVRVGVTGKYDTHTFTYDV